MQSSIVDSLNSMSPLGLLLDLWNQNCNIVHVQTFSEQS